MARNRKNVVFLPRWTDENPYLENVAAALTVRGYSVELADYAVSSFPISKMARLRPAAGIIHLHWISPLVERMYWQTSPLKKAIKCWILILMTVLDVKLAQARGVKVVWTVHNLVSHDAQDEEIEIKLRRALANAVDLLCFHSREAQQLVFETYRLSDDTNACVTPHACYGDYYGELKQVVSRDQPTNGVRGEFVFLFFGIIRRYKGVEALIEAFSKLEGDDLRLLIAGKVFPAEDEAWLRKATEADPRISFRNGFVPREQLGDLIASSDAVVLPFARTLSSGSALLSITYGKPLVLPESARVFGVPGDEGAVYFGDPTGLSDALERTLAANTRAMGQHNAELAKELTWGAMAEVLDVRYPD
ncbi:MAG: hypothetical protein CL583_05130 [Alteromonadaceae bacterium]|nr:hypothetical protein [Alteromonadaceae bacterium]